MSFLFKSSKKGSSGSNPNAPLPPASRDLRSSDGPTTTSQIPTLNGIPGIGSQPNSPTYAKSANASISSITEKEMLVPAGSRPSEDRVAHLREDSIRSAGPLSLEQKSLRESSKELSRENHQRLPISSRPSTEGSPYPWSQRRLNFTSPSRTTSPFPRYGAAVNATSSKDGAIYLMGGLINGSTVKGDLWMVEANSPTLVCSDVATTSEGPGPRVGHASLLVGNAFIVFGGDTKLNDGDMLDDTLYLLNTSTKQWSRALPAGPRPPGRYGHTLNILGSKIYIFGGQVEGYFFNDLVAFDLNALQQATNRWEILIQNTIDGGPPHGQIPPARTNHTTVTWGDRLYLFGGTDGVNWFNDVWSYSPHSNSWTQLECIGYIPSPREGHAASLVGDVMYIFGGRNEQGNDLGDLAAFRISSRRWYTFQNMGPSPSPRSGHSMTTVGKQIVVLAGEPSSAPRDPVELAMAYFLDTTKIRYPPDSASQQSSAERIQTTRRPSRDRAGSQSRGPHPKDIERSGSGEGRIRTPEGSRLPRAQGQLPVPSGPPPRAPGQPTGIPTARQPPRSQDRAFSPGENERPKRFDSPAAALDAARASPAPRLVPTSPPPDDDSSYETPPTSGQSMTQQTPTYASLQSQPTEVYNRSNSRTQATRDQERHEETPRQSVDNSTENLPQVRKMSEETYMPQDSGIGSSPAFNQQHETTGVAHELDQVKKQNAWYASELALARKAGYQARSTTDSPVFDERGNDAFADDDRPLIEALLNMRTELAKVQDTIEIQSRNAAERIAEIEKQRDAAINEAVFAKAKLAGQSGDSPRVGRDSPHDRTNDISRRLASSLEAQRELSRRVDSLIGQLESEKRAREAAEDTSQAAEKRVLELNSFRQTHSAEMESLRTELHQAQKEARDATANHAEIFAQHRLLAVDKEELSGKLDSLSSDTQNHTSILSSLREAVAASTDKAELLGRQLQAERDGKSEVERHLRELRLQHDERTTELESARKRLQDAEDLASKHAEEARTHQQAVMAGLGQVSQRSLSASGANDERIAILQQQMEAANAMVRQNQGAADAASDKLRLAEERIAGLEAYQEQASREGLSIRKQLQATTKENHNLSTEKAELEHRLERHMLETNALSVQHASLKDILEERGINPSDKRRSRALDSPIARFGTPDQLRAKDLEQQLESAVKGHEDMKVQFEEVSERGEKMKREYDEKLTALDNDHQAAVKYLRGTEKMLSKMKQELARVKSENGDLKKKIEKSKEGVSAKSGSADWEVEKTKLQQEFSASQSTLQKSVSELEGRIDTVQARLQSTEQELEQTKHSHTTAQNDLATLQTTFSQTRTDMDRLQRENSLLEQRAQDAENKVQLLLDQVESSVDNYRRRSRSGTNPHHAAATNGTSHARHPSTSETSDDAAAPKTHSRNVSNTSAVSAHSAFSDDDPAADAEDDSRNSIALDSLASELDALRTHWETTNRNYRLSDRFDFERTPTSATPGGAGAGSLVDWRRGLDIDDDDHDDAALEGTSAGKEGEALDASTPTAERPGIVGLT